MSPIHAEAEIYAARSDLDRWMKTLPSPWTAAMVATIFTGWIYDHLKPRAAALGGASADAARHRRVQAEKRSHRCTG